MTKEEYEAAVEILTEKNKFKKALRFWETKICEPENLLFMWCEPITEQITYLDRDLFYAFRKSSMLLLGEKIRELDEKFSEI